MELHTKLRNHAKYYSACKEIHTGKAAFLNGVLTKGSPIFKYIESSPCTGIHKQWEMHENGLALPLLAAVILVTALVSSPSHRDGRRPGRRTRMVSLRKLRNVFPWLC